MPADSQKSMSTLSFDLKLHIPEVLRGDVSYWCDARHVPDSGSHEFGLGTQFRVTEYGEKANIS